MSGQRRAAGFAAWNLVLAGAAPPLLSLLVFWPATTFEFVGFDDPLYVSENRMVGAGLHAEGLRWAFNVGYAGNWHPLTWLSHMLDVEWFGLDPGAHHRTNVGLHALNVLLVFLLLRRLLAGAAWASALGAALFGVHPLRLESVAWISERKELLCATFWLLAVLAYLSYARRGGALRYLAVPACMALSSMAKAMAVTLPLVLLLLDLWPLRRIAGWTRDDSARAVSLGRALLEKLPLAALAAGSAWLTLLAQRAGGAVSTLETLPLGARLANATVTYVAYLADTCWPARLAPFYPYPSGGWPSSLVITSGSVLLALTIGAWMQRRRRSWLLVGWGWYLVTLVPVIGLVQVGMQGRADRYTYVPHLGLCLVLACSVAAGFSRRGAPRALLALVGALALFAATSATRSQLPHWRDTEALFVRATESTPGNYLAHYGLSLELERKGDLAEAAVQAELSAAMHPGFSRAYDQWGRCLAALGRVEEGLKQIRKAIELRPDDASAYQTLGGLLTRVGRTAEAVEALRRSVVLDPNNPAAFTQLALALEHQGAVGQAEQALRRALDLDPGQFSARRGLGRLLLRLGRDAEARQQLDAAEALRPGDAEVLEGLALLDLRQGEIEAAVERQRRLRSLDPARADRLQQQIDAAGPTQGRQ